MADIPDKIERCSCNPQRFCAEGCLTCPWCGAEDLGWGDLQEVKVHACPACGREFAFPHPMTGEAVTVGMRSPADVAYQRWLQEQGR